MLLSCPAGPGTCPENDFIGVAHEQGACGAWQAHCPLALHGLPLATPRITASLVTNAGPRPSTPWLKKQLRAEASTSSGQGCAHAPFFLLSHPHPLSLSTNISSAQSLSRVRLCDPMNRSTPGLPVHHQLPEFTQTHVQHTGLLFLWCLPN